MRVDAQHGCFIAQSTETNANGILFNMYDYAITDEIIYHEEKKIEK